MADDALRRLRRGDPTTLEEFRALHAGALRSAFERGTSETALGAWGWERFADCCLLTVARRVSTREQLAHRLPALLAHSDLHLALGLQELDPAALERGLIRFKESLHSQWSEASRVFHGFTLSEPEYGEKALACSARTALAMGHALDLVLEKRLRLPDFYLAAAALSRNRATAENAKTEFTRLYYAPVILPYARKQWSSAGMTEDKAQDLFFCVLYEHTPSDKTGNPSASGERRAPLLAEYRGEGPLAGWLTLTFGNMVRDSLRTAREHASLDEERESEDGNTARPKYEPTVPAAQAENLDRGPCMEMLRGGASLGWKSLKPREQLVLILQTLHQVPPSVIARRIFNVHEGTITKYTTNGIEKIKEAILSFARQHGGMNQGEIEDCFRYARAAFPEARDLAGGMVLRAARGDS
ncbi:MAG: sigma-70 family RNA polymerase sigma factor [Candidatus Omnitrophica bacterium]|nr:hypothetical protein [bacterium]NUN95335.1 sigma-70 family RNA polymerase sigma factor [Candidatus Omnitrophota bacterium]